MKKLYNKSIWKSRETKQLLAAMLSLETKSEAGAFLRDIMTEAEILEFANRLQAAKMLDSERTYTEIQQVTGLSTTTIARISGWLKAGTGGYGLIIDRLNHRHTSPDRAG